MAEGPPSELPATPTRSACQAGEAPLNCELRVNRPSIMFIIVGRNDVIANTPVDQFAANLDTVIDAGWVKMDVVCQGVDAGMAPAACK